MINSTNVVHCLSIIYPVLEVTTTVKVTNILACVLNGLFMPVTIIANLLVILTIWKARELQTCSNLGLVCLAITDLLVACCAQPLFIVRRVLELHGEFKCVVIAMYQLLSATCVTMSYWTLTFISYERLLAVFRPFWHHYWVTPRRIFAGFALVCLVSTILIVIRGAANLSSTVYFLVSGILIMFSCISIIIIYTKIYHISKVIRERIKRENIPTAREDRQQLKETRASKTFALVIVIVGACYTPWFIVAIYSGITSVDVSVYCLFAWADTVLFINSLLNPVIYFLKNTQLRRTMLVFVCGHPMENRIAPESSFIT